MPLERWYRHAAVFLWPEARHFEIICSRDSRGVVPELVRMIGRRKRAGAKDRAAFDAGCHDLAAAIIARWPAQSFRGAQPRPTSTPASSLLECLATLDAPQLVGNFLGAALTRDVSADPGPSLVLVGQKFGWQTFRPQLVSVMKETRP